MPGNDVGYPLSTAPAAGDVLARLRRTPERLLVGLALVAVLGALTLGDTLVALDNAVYDRALRLLGRPAPDDIVIVAIDERSLAVQATEYGQRWPWPRAVHAELIERLRIGGARAVLVDVLFTELDSLAPHNDELLAAALAAHGRVVLPLHLAALPGETPSGASVARLSAVFPTPTLAPYAAALGHTHNAFDQDGILRELALAVGSGEQRIPHAAAALAELLSPGTLTSLPGIRYHAPSNAEGWFRDYRVRVPFAGPPGHFQQVSYASVLAMDEQTLRRRFADTVVLVGATAPGMDLIPTPVSGQAPMAGVEVNANLFDALRSNRTLEPAGRPAQLAIGIVVILLTYLWFARLSARWVLPLTLGAGAVSIALSVAGLGLTGLWFAPAATLTTLLAAYLLWSFQRLGTAVTFLRLELVRLDAESRSLSPPPALGFEHLVRHAELLAGVHGMALFTADGRRLAALGEAPAAPPSRRVVSWQWRCLDDSWWRRIAHADGERILCAATGSDTLDGDTEAVLEAVARRLAAVRPGRPSGAVERIEQRIEQVREASDALSAMRRFVDDSLENMADGVLVTDALGQVQQANGNAIRFLAMGGEETPLGEPIVLVLERLEFEQPAALPAAIAAVQMSAKPAHLYARGPGERDYLVQMTAHGASDGTPYPLIVSLADISALRASERRRAELLSFISHDLRAPLVSTLALTQIATLKPERMAQGQTIARIETNVKKTLELADDFLHLARAETSEPLPLSPVDLVEAARAAAEQARAQAEARGTALQLLEPAEPVLVRGERGLLERMVLNLLTNAVKYSPDAASVELHIEASDGRARLKVRDNGYGIPDAALPTLFDRFRRVEQAVHRGESGAGLGLAFVRSVVERHGGQIEVESTVNLGTTFTIDLPLAQTATDAQPREARA